MKQKVSYIKAISFQALHDGSCSFYWVHQPNGYLFIYPSSTDRTLLRGRHFDRFGPPYPHPVIIRREGARKRSSHTRHSLSPDFPLLHCVVVLPALWAGSSFYKREYPSILFKAGETKNFIISLRVNSR